jgi:hypothetical protein
MRAEAPNGEHIWTGHDGRQATAPKGKGTLSRKEDQVGAEVGDDSESPKAVRQPTPVHGLKSFYVYERITCSPATWGFCDAATGRETCKDPGNEGVCQNNVVLQHDLAHGGLLPAERWLLLSLTC